MEIQWFLDLAEMLSLNPLVLCWLSAMLFLVFALAAWAWLFYGGQNED